MATASAVTLENGITLSYAEDGDPDGPVLVCLPGPTDSWRSYESVLERLPESIRAIAVSQRGHGESDKPDEGYGVEDFAHDTRLLLDALGIESAVLAAHSGSCPVARRVAIDHPASVVGLVLEASPTTLRGDAGLEEFVTSTVADLQDPIDPDFVRSFVLGTSSETMEPALADELVAEVLKVPARVWREVFPVLLQYDDMAELAGIHCPTLLIWGDSDTLVTRAMQDELVDRVPGAELIVYAGLGHTPRWEDPSRFASDVAAFVERLFEARR